VIDADYRGTLQVLLFNHDATEPFEVRIGDRIAQLVLERVSGSEPVLVPLEELCPPPLANEATAVAPVRGAGGFGSTGV
jgi:dUTP pyrophosphatase